MHYYLGCTMQTEHGVGKLAKVGGNEITVDYRDYENKGYIDPLGTEWEFIYLEDEHDIDSVAPILIPITELNKEELKQQGFDTHIDLLTHEAQPPLEAPFKMVSYLISKYYDVFGLIESGQAIADNRTR